MSKCCFVKITHACIYPYYGVIHVHSMEDFENTQNGFRKVHEIWAYI
jgi:hypothetical protein